MSGEWFLLAGVLATLVYFVGHYYGTRDGWNQAVDHLTNRWLRQCLVCGRDHITHAAAACSDGKRLQDEIRARWKDIERK